MHNSSQMMLLLLPVIILQLAVQIYAIIDLTNRKKTKNLSMIIWLLIIIFGELLGSVLYFLIGRSDD